jgi:hypothetical protein
MKNIFKNMLLLAFMAIPLQANITLKNTLNLPIEAHVKIVSTTNKNALAGFDNGLGETGTGEAINSDKHEHTIQPDSELSLKNDYPLFILKSEGLEPLPLDDLANNASYTITRDKTKMIITKE